MILLCGWVLYLNVKHYIYRVHEEKYQYTFKFTSAIDNTNILDVQYYSKNTQFRIIREGDVYKCVYYLKGGQEAQLLSENLEADYDGVVKSNVINFEIISITPITSLTK
jgi:hypothetical protein